MARMERRGQAARWRPPGVRLTPTETATASSTLAATKRVELVLRSNSASAAWAAVDTTLVSESDDRIGESCPLLWGVDPFVDGGERVPAPVGVVVLD